MFANRCPWFSFLIFFFLVDLRLRIMLVYNKNWEACFLYSVFWNNFYNKRYCCSLNITEALPAKASKPGVLSGVNSLVTSIFFLLGYWSIQNFVPFGGGRNNVDIYESFSGEAFKHSTTSYFSFSVILFILYVNSMNCSKMKGLHHFHFST